MTYHDAVRAAKRRIVTDALREAGGSRLRAARALGLQRTMVQRLIRELEIDVPGPPRGRLRVKEQV